MATQTRSKPNPATERQRQQRLRDRRKEDGWKRLTIWLNPQEADILAALGDEWMGRTVKALLADAMGVKGQPITLHAVPSDDPVEAPGAVLLKGDPPADPAQAAQRLRAKREGSQTVTVTGRETDDEAP